MINEMLNNIKQNIEKKQQKEQQPKEQQKATIDHSTYIYDPYSNTYRKIQLRKPKLQEVRLNYYKFLEFLKKLQQKELIEFKNFIVARNFRNEFNNFVVIQRVERIRNYEHFKKALKEVLSSENYYFDAIMNPTNKVLYKTIILYSESKNDKEEVLKAIVFTAKEDKHVIPYSFVYRKKEVVEDEHN